MKTIAVWLMAISFLVFTILLILFLLSDGINTEANGFTRKIEAIKPTLIRELSFDAPLNKICGMSNSSIYLSGQRPDAIFILDKQDKFRDTMLINLNIPVKKLVPNTIVVDSPELYLYINNVKSLIYGQFPAHQLKLIEFKGQLFTKAVNISNASSIVRAFNDKGDKQVFKKISNSTGAVMKEVDVIKSETKDAGMSNDGMLLHEPLTARVLYLEYLSNQFYCLDTNLNLIYKGHTIDTTSKVLVKKQVQKLRTGQNKIAPAVARKTVNKQCFVDQKCLYVVSALKADNESRTGFNRQVVIDRYLLASGKYKDSFYLEKIKNKPFKSAVVRNDTLYVLYEQKLSLYHLPK